jgi:CubicO group peptidase (beta-lactamase class C family)
MKSYLILLFVLNISLHSYAQLKYKVSYQDLKSYEGLYEYVNHGKIEIAASPKDTILYAFINQSLYPLRPLSKDVFKNNSGDDVRFLRSANNEINSYIAGKDTFKLLSKSVVFPRTMWYAKTPYGKQPYKYVYHRPVAATDGLPTGALKGTGLDPALLAEMTGKIANGTYFNVHSVLIVKSGKLVFEEYFYQYTADSLHELRSASKSFVSALAGLAIQKGYIKNKNQKVVSYFPEYKLENESPLKQNITVENLLSNQTGLDCDISNEKSVGNETKMNYSDDWVKFTLDLPMMDTPGHKGMYCSGNPITLGRIIEKTSKQPLAAFALKGLFKPLGITNFRWNFKPDKFNAEDFCQIYLRPRDMAKFGQLYLDGGKWHGKQVLPADWVTASVSKHSVVQNVAYGYLWWLKYLDVDGVRYNGIAAQGNGGQRIFLFPKLKMVIVTTGGNYNSQSPADEIIAKYILAGYDAKNFKTNQSK